MFIKECWYVAGWASEVDEHNFLARRLLDTPVVLWRDTTGQVIAFEDRCCHRGAPLSRGRREGDCIRCMYHGLKFDSAGICVEIPGQSLIPKEAKVASYPVLEKHKWIWIWMGDAAKADVNLIPDTRWLDDPAWRSLEGYTHYDTNYLLIADNLLDLAHLPYVHPTTLGGSEDYAQNLPKVEPLERGVRVTRSALNTAPPGFVQKVRPFAGKIDRWNNYDFLIPGVFLMDSGMVPTGQDIRPGHRTDAAEFHSCQALTPESEHSTHYFFAQPHNFAIDQPEVTASIHQSVVEAFEEDRSIVTAQALNLSAHGGFSPLGIRADEALTRYRLLVQKTLRKEASEHASEPPARQTLKPVLTTS